VFCEMVLLQQFVRGAKLLYSDHDFEEPNLWFQTEIISKMQWYFATSFVTIFTNIILYTFLAVTSVLILLKCVHNEHGQSPEFGRILVHANACNILINVFMTVSCFPRRSWNAYYLLKSLSMRSSLGLPPPSDLHKEIPTVTQEQVEEFKNLESIRKPFKRSARALTGANLPFGFRPIERNWVRNPYTNEKEFIPTPSPSDSKKETSTSSGDAIELIIPEGFDFVEKPSEHSTSDLNTGCNVDRARVAIE